MGVSHSRRHFLKSASLSAAWSCLGAQAVIAEPQPGAPASGLLQSGISASSWKLFRGDLQNSGVAISPLPETLRLLWELKSPDGIASTPVIDAGKTYVGTISGELHCLNLLSGMVEWTYQSVEDVPKNSFAPAFNAPLAVDHTHVYGGDDAGRFHAVDRNSGKPAWTFDTDAEIVGGALVFEGKVLFGSHDNHLYCLKADSGEELWRCDTQGPVNATPTLAGQYTFTTGCDQPIMRVIDVQSGMQVEEVPLAALLLASAAVREEILYFGTDGGTVYALDWRKRKTVWEYSVPGRQQRIQSSPAVTDDVVVIGSRDKHLHCLDRLTGEPRWTFATRAQIDGSPVIVGERVFFGSGDKNLYAVSLEQGRELWRFPAGQAITGSPAVADGKLVIGCDTTGGRILCFGE